MLTTGVAAERPGPGWSVAASICGAVVSLTRALAVPTGSVVTVDGGYVLV